MIYAYDRVKRVMPIRVVHFSDVHLTAPKLGWKGPDMLSKKVTGWINVKLLGRGHRFKHAADIAPKLIEDVASRNFDLAVFTGDATKLAFPAEFQVAAEKLRVGSADLPKVICVPGNHDLYNHADVKAGQFEQTFAPWMVGERLPGKTFPYAVRVGHCSFIAINSSRSNFWPFDASGKLGTEQLDDFRAMCETLPEGPRIVITHYPLRKANGRPEAVTRRLRDHRKAARVAAECGVSLWLCGHIHRGFTLLPNDDLPFPVIASGSATQTDRWQYNEYTIDGDQVTLLKRRYDFDAGCYQDSETMNFQLKSMSFAERV